MEKCIILLTIRWRKTNSFSQAPSHQVLAIAVSRFHRQDSLQSFHFPEMDFCLHCHTNTDTYTHFLLKFHIIPSMQISKKTSKSWGTTRVLHSISQNKSKLVTFLVVSKEYFSSTYFAFNAYFVFQFKYSDPQSCTLVLQATSSQGILNWQMLRYFFCNFFYWIIWRQSQPALTKGDRLLLVIHWDCFSVKLKQFLQPTNQMTNTFQSSLNSVSIA